MYYRRIVEIKINKNSKHKCKKTKFEKDSYGDKMAHLKPQKIDILIDFLALFHH